jgi:SAM-dependent methyltransferase
MLKAARWRRSDDAPGPSPAALADDARKVVLHVGCGPRNPETLYVRFRGPEWREVRLDIDPAVEPDIVGSMVDMGNVASASVDAVWSSHNIEHVYGHEVPAVLAEFKRVLRPGGELLLTTPDLQYAAERIAAGLLEDPAYRSPSGMISPHDMLYGHGSAIAKGNEYMAHRTGFTARTLSAKLQAAGFEEVRVKRVADDYALWATGWRPLRARRGARRS